MAATKLRSSSMSLHGVSHKSRVFDPTCLFEAKAKPMIQQKRLFDSYIVNDADVEKLSPDINCISFFLFNVASLLEFKAVKLNLVGGYALHGLSPQVYDMAVVSKHIPHTRD